MDFADIARLRDQSGPRTRPLHIHVQFGTFFHSILRLPLAKHIIPEGYPFGVDTAVNRWAALPVLFRVKSQPSTMILNPARIMSVFVPWSR
jgi:hypothetical protein